MVISYKNIGISIEDEPILKDVNIEVKEKEFIFLTGKVGTGKTTFLRSLYGMLPVKGKEASVLDFNMLKLKRKKLPELRKQLGIVFQTCQLLPDRTVYANLEFVLKATGWKNKKTIKERIEEVLDAVAMKDKADSFPFKLSGGEQQRIAIARAILNTPKLIIADEPTGNLDEETSNNIFKILNDICQNGTAVIMSTHRFHLIPTIQARVFNCEDHTLTETTSTYY